MCLDKGIALCVGKRFRILQSNIFIFFKLTLYYKYKLSVNRTFWCIVHKYFSELEKLVNKSRIRKAFIK